MTTTTNIQLENYTLDQQVGQGRLTTVYQASRKSDHAIVAIKVAAPESTTDEDYVRRFKEGAQQAARLEHPNIARTYEANQEGDVLYLVREFIDTRSLAQLLRESGPLPPARMLTIAKQIAAALDYAHQKSLTHGDLSANRVYVGLNDHTTVADFGQTQAIAGTSLAPRGTAAGSAIVMAPERVKGQGPSRQSDLYSLGVLCYQMLAGEPPFKGSTEAVLEAHAQEQPHSLHLLNPAIPLALSETIGRMLAKGLELRYNTGSEFTRAMEVAIQGTAPSRTGATTAAQLRAVGGSRRRWWQQSWIWAIGGLLFIGLLLMAGFGAVSIWNSLQSTQVASQTEATLPPSQPTLAPAVDSNETAPTEATAEATPPPDTVVELVMTPTSAVSATATATLPPTETTTPVPLPTPGPPTIRENSPFTNLVVAHGISNDEQPERVGLSFAPGTDPIYLFFDYEEIEAGTEWTHRWRWADTELDTFQDVWPERYSPTGTAWVFYKPAGGFQTGPYQVTLEINGSTVATATFVVQPGGF